MKLYSLFFIPLLPLTVFAQKKEARLQLSYMFTGVKEGYNYNEKVDIYLNDVLIFSGRPAAMDEKREMIIGITPGTWQLRLESYVWYNDQWEAQTIANGYNIDAVWEQTITLKKKKRLNIDLEFDISANAIREL
jgi:hypothetical protein